MNKLFTTIAASLFLTVPALADPAVKGWKTYDSMGCMLVRECKDGVKLIANTAELEALYPFADFGAIREELDKLFVAFGNVNIEVFLADEKYFPRGHRGVYHTPTNKFFLNEAYMDDPETVIEVVRHEGWHAGQDCMAGTLDNNSIAIIKMPETIPQRYHLTTEIAYAHQPAAIPWEIEAKWAGYTPYETVKVLEACATGAPWEVIEPTPKTREWLVDKGYIR